MAARIAVCVLVPFLAAAAENPGRRVDQIFAQFDKPGSPGAAVAVARKGEIVYKHGYGLANLEYDIPITPATVFHVASVSKQFTAMAILLLEQQSRLSIDATSASTCPKWRISGGRSRCGT